MCNKFIMQNTDVERFVSFVNILKRFLKKKIFKKKKKKQSQQKS